MRWSKVTAWLAASAQVLPGVQAITLNMSDSRSVEQAAITAGTNMLQFYNGTTPGYAPGILTNPYYWWEAGAMFGIMIHFWHLTGNDTFNQLVMDGLLWQKGDNNDFEPVNQTKDLGNDDQSFWAYAALDAAEFAFPNPPAGNPSWLALAQAVFNRQINRWEPSICGGGMRWQIYPFNPGWTYKNTAANGGLMHISARLARFTGNDTYAQTANMIWDWLVSVNFLQMKDNQTMQVIDGSSIDDNCKGPDTDGILWTYNHGTVLMGAAYMYNYTNGSSIWRTRLDQLVNGAKIFFVHEDDSSSNTSEPDLHGTILSEVACELQTPQTCKIDQPAFKSMLIRWLAVTTQIAPYTAKTILPLVNDTAVHAAKQCVGTYGTTDIWHDHPASSGGTWCGRRWYSDIFDTFSGLGEQMSAMSAFQNVLIANSTPPYTTVTGGNSTSDPNAGNTPTHPTILQYIYSKPVSKGDIAGAWILTALSLIIMVVGTVWMVREEPADSWGGSGPNAGWMNPSAGTAAYYKKTYGYGAYRLAGLQAGGVYAGKNASTRLRASAKPTAPAIGLGSGGWWFGTGQGVGEKWWDKKHEEHAEEQAEKAASKMHIARESVNSYDSHKGLFARTQEVDTGSSREGSEAAAAPTSKPTGGATGFFSRFKSGDSGSVKSSSTAPAKPSSTLPGGKNEKAGEWKRIGNGVYVRASPVNGGSGSGAATPAAAPNRSSAMPSRTTSQAPSRVQSPPVQSPRVMSPEPGQTQLASTRQSRAPSVAKGKTLHWPAAPPEPEVDSDEE